MFDFRQAYAYAYVGLAKFTVWWKMQYCDVIFARTSGALPSSLHAMKIRNNYNPWTTWNLLKSREITISPPPTTLLVSLYPFFDVLIFLELYIWKEYREFSQISVKCAHCTRLTKSNLSPSNIWNNWYIGVIRKWIFFTFLKNDCFVSKNEEVKWKPNKNDSFLNDLFRKQ